MEDDDRIFIYRIGPEHLITFVSQEWLDFARENQASELTPENVLGQPLDRFIAGWETKHLYELIYESARRKPDGIRIPFSCDSPTMRRSFEMHIRPFAAGGLEFIVRVIKMEPTSLRPILDNWREHSPEIVVICSWCKRIRCPDGHWVEIENAMEYRELFGASPPNLTHDVCPDCFAAIHRQIDDADLPPPE